MTTKQQLAAKRNWSKRRILGATSLINMQGITHIEKTEIQMIYGILEGMLSKWDKRSKELGLVPGITYNVFNKDGSIFKKDVKYREAREFRESGFKIEKNEL